MVTSLRRVIKAGFINFWRNGAVSWASVFVFTITLFVFGSLILGNAILSASLAQAKDKIDITIYFDTEAAETDIMHLEESIEQMPEVKEVTYISRAQALEEFRESHQDDALILQSLDELEGENPLRAELHVKAHDPNDYVAIVGSLESDTVITAGGGANIIDEIDFEDNREAIERFTAFIDSVENIGFYMAVAAAIIAVLVAFTTISLGIYNAREEISVMRLVGAGDNYIRGPFIVEGIMYGIFAAVFALAILYPLTRWVSNATNEFYGSIDLFTYYIQHIPVIAGILFASGVILGMISSFLALRRYLKI